jgi:hypothetical protein
MKQIGKQSGCHGGRGNYQALIRPKRFNSDGQR